MKMTKGLRNLTINLPNFNGTRNQTYGHFCIYLSYLISHVKKSYCQILQDLQRDKNFYQNNPGVVLQIIAKRIQVSSHSIKFKAK